VTDDALFQWPVVVCSRDSGGLYNVTLGHEYRCECLASLNGSLVTVDGLRRIARTTFRPVEVRERHVSCFEHGAVCWPLGHITGLRFDERRRELRGFFSTPILDVQRSLEDAFFENRLAAIGLSAILNGVRVCLPGWRWPVFEPQALEYVDLTGDDRPACGGHFCHLNVIQTSELGMHILDRQEELPPGRNKEIEETTRQLRFALSGCVVA
jgi:hypothetical protein